MLVPSQILLDAIEQCPCTLRERDSGHRIGCIAPVLQDMLAAAKEDKP